MISLKVWGFLPDFIIRGTLLVWGGGHGSCSWTCLFSNSFLLQIFYVNLGTFPDFFETHLFKYLCNIYYMISTMLGPGDTVVDGVLYGCFNKGKVTATHDSHSVNGLCVSYHHLEGEPTFRFGFKRSVAKHCPLGKKNVDTITFY